MSLNIADIPQSLRPIAHFVKIANEYSDRDVVIYYWCLLKALEEGMRLSGSDPSAKTTLLELMTLLEKVKQANKENDAIMQELVAQSHIEDQAQKLFQYAESQDRQSQFNQKMIKAFYTCGYLFDVLTCFGQLDENIQSARKYAKWRATYIHHCLKKGEQPTPGSQMTQQGQQQQDRADSDDIAAQINDELSAELNALNASMNPPPRPPPQQQQQQFPQIPTQHQHFVPQQPPQQPTSNFLPHGHHQHPMFGLPGLPRPGIQDPFRGGAGIPQAGQGPQHHPGPAAGFQQPQPSRPGPAASMSPQQVPAAQPTQGLTLEDYLEAKKYTKYAASALDYEDPKTAIEYMQKAIALLQKDKSVGPM